MSNSNALSLNNSISPSDVGSNSEQLIQNTNNNNENNDDNENNDNDNENNDNTIDKESASTTRQYSFKEKFISTFLNIKLKKKKKKKEDNKLIEDEFINKNLKLKDVYTFETESNYSEEIEEPTALKFRNMVKKVLRIKKNKNWEEFLKEYERKMKQEKSVKFRMKNIFNVNSDFIIIWKLTFSAFNIIFLFIFFLKYILLELAVKKSNEETEKSNRIFFVYCMINIMFTFEFLFSLLIIIFNGGSIFTYIKLPLKLYCIIPFPLQKKYIFCLIPKFFRIDIVNRLFNLLEIFINEHVGHYILNYYLKVFLTYILELFKFLLLFGLYAHCLCCFYCFFEGQDTINYVSSLYYNIQAFTTIGFGEQSPKTIGGMIIMTLTLFLGVNFMSVITSNIRYIFNKIQKFNRETSFNEQFEFLIFQIQRSTGKIFPNHLKTLMHLFLFYRRGMAYYEIKNKNKFLFDNCREHIIKEINANLFNYLKNDFRDYFENCEDEFVFEIFQNMRPKMFEANRTLINYNQKVKALYFLMGGYIFIFNKNQTPVFCVFGNNLFAEYEFITQQKCNFIVKTHPKKTSFGFELKKEDWDRISQKYINSTNKFLETIKKRKRKHNIWIDYSMSKFNKNLISGQVNYEQNIINTKKKENKKEKKDELLIDLIDIVVNDKEEKLIQEDKNEKKIDKSLIMLAKERNEKYDIQNEEIFFNIFELRKKLKSFEDQFLDFKKALINHFKIN